jgi:Cu2+-exporting ATPase
MPLIAVKCLHCGTEVPASVARDGYCCEGCRAVSALLRNEGLSRFYDLAQGEVLPVPESRAGRSLAWLEPLLERALSRTPEGGLCTLELDVQGVHCAACVWLMNELYRREAGASEIIVNPGLGKVLLRFWPGRLNVDGFLRKVERFGYLFGESQKRPNSGSSELPLRLGISAALSLNVMLFSAAFYAGLAPVDGELFSLFRRLSWVLTTVVVGVGGWPFFRAAWQGLRRGLLHLDLPIALGILLVFLASGAQALKGQGGGLYLDTLNVFITLMLLGRWLQQRLLEKNRRFLLEQEGAESLFTRRQEGSGLRAVRVTQVKAGDLLVLAPGELLPVEGHLIERGGKFSTEWINGEPAARAVEEGAAVAAGSFNASDSAATVRAATDFQGSSLAPLLRPVGSGEPAPLKVPFWAGLSKGWVAGVLLLSAVGYWAWRPYGAGRAMEVAVSLLVVTCPCAIGLAVPLAYELAQARLRRQGFLIRRGDLLDRLKAVRNLLFDKTGTLTLNRLELAAPQTLLELGPEERDVAYNLAVRSAHPVSRCLAEALERQGAVFQPSFQARETKGQGMEGVLAGGHYRLGESAWATLGTMSRGETVLAAEGKLVKRFVLREAVRRDAQEEIARLQALGYRTWLVSGDGAQRVRGLAKNLGIPASNAFSEQSPRQKAELTARVGLTDTLFLGDGVNDSLAFEQALCAGTPAIDRPVLPGKADFFLLGEGLGPLREALELSRTLRRVISEILMFALAYNLLAITACFLGQMTPLRAAVAMPVGSLATLLFTALSLKPRSRSKAFVFAVQPQEVTA